MAKRREPEFEDSFSYNEDLHPSWLSALTCRKLDEIIKQNDTIIELLDKISKK
tara:strand:- start:891 stop:1049 length:159 start_codon:yes stop_codon:yes gene_type:complete